MAIGILFRAGDAPRGFRNNNPLNIKYNPTNNWDGQVGTDGPFVVFDSAESGIRAAGKILDSYGRRGITNVERIIHTWAPAHDNNTPVHYVAFVTNKADLSPNTIPNTHQRARMVAAMIQYENGNNPFSEVFIKNALALA